MRVYDLLLFLFAARPRALRSLKCSLMLMACISGISFGAPLLTTAVSVPNDTFTPSVVGGHDTQTYLLQLKRGETVIAEAKGQSDYGILKNYVYSNIGPSTIAFESAAATGFQDMLTVESPIAGFLTVHVSIEGAIEYLDTPSGPTAGFNGQTFGSLWTLANAASGEVSDCPHRGISANVSSLSIDCTLRVSVQNGTNRIHFNGELQTLTLGRASATKMDLFHTAKVTSMGVFDSDGNLLSALIRADSGTSYPDATPPEVPEPGTWALSVAGLVAGTLARRQVS